MEHMVEDDVIDIERAKEAQDKYCNEHHDPHFAPYSGFCFCCGGQIYSVITVAEAGRRLITGCPICCRSYCD